MYLHTKNAGKKIAQPRVSYKYEKSGLCPTLCCKITDACDKKNVTKKLYATGELAEFQRSNSSPMARWR